MIKANQILVFTHGEYDDYSIYDLYKSTCSFNLEIKYKNFLKDYRGEKSTENFCNYLMNLFYIKRIHYDIIHLIEDENSIDIINYKERF